jgi:adenine-specific DNA-methyltransferase
MPTLDWIGKEAVINHHNDVEFRLLEHDSKLSHGEPNTGNMLIEGDNLLALKALLPYYKEKVDFIYIDPPYNTGNEDWIYNDNLNSPQMKEWLGKVVDRDGLSRHDKWLCMMYPRLTLLKKLLSNNGIIFISIDDNEESYLHQVLNEIFGERHFIQKIIWKNKYGPGAMTKGFGNVHEYIFCYSKKIIENIQAPLSEESEKNYKQRDDKFETRGGYVTQPLATRSKDPRPNLVYPVYYKDEEIYPDKQWIWSKNRLYKAIENDEVIFKKTKDKWSVRFKQYLKNEKGEKRLAKPISILNGPFNQEGTWEIENLFGNKDAFNNPKPTALIEYLLSMIVNEKKNKKSLILDSFSGSGSTGHSVLNINKKYNKKSKFILIEMDPKISKTVTRERLVMGINGYYNKRKKCEKNGTGGGFDYYRLGETVFTADGKIRSTIKFKDLARHVFYSALNVPLDDDKKLGKSPLIGKHNATAVYLLYNGILKDKSAKGGNALTRKVLVKLPKHHGPKIIYGTSCRLSYETLRQNTITFKQIPYHIKVS